MVELLSWHVPGQKVVALVDIGGFGIAKDQIVTIRSAAICRCKCFVMIKFFEVSGKQYYCGGFKSTDFQPVVEDKKKEETSARDPLDDLRRFAANPSFDPDQDETVKPRELEPA